MAIEFDIKYEAGHSYKEIWEKTDYHCPKCGEKTVWHETGPGDYYVGETFLCTACDAHFYLPSEPSPSNTWQDKQRLEAIKKASSA